MWCTRIPFLRFEIVSDIHTVRWKSNLICTLPVGWTGSVFLVPHALCSSSTRSGILSHKWCCPKQWHTEPWHCSHGKSYTPAASPPSFDAAPHNQCTWAHHSFSLKITGMGHYYNNCEEHFRNYLPFDTGPLLLCFRGCTIAEPRRVNHPKEEMTAHSLKEQTASFSTANLCDFMLQLSFKAGYKIDIWRIMKEIILFIALEFQKNLK